MGRGRERAFVLNPTLGQTLDRRRRRATQRGAARSVRPISRRSSAQRFRHSYLARPRNIQISRLKSVSPEKMLPEPRAAAPAWENGTPDL